MPLALQPPCPSATVLSLQPPSPICHPDRTRISYLTALASDRLCGSPKENHMQLIEAATLDRKSGAGEGPAVRPSVDPHLPFVATLFFVILSEAPRRSVAQRRVYSAKSKDPGDAHWQMLFGAFRPQTTRKVKKITTSERSASQMDRVPQCLVCAKSKDLGNDYSQMLSGAFRPQTKKSQR